MKTAIDKNSEKIIIGTGGTNPGIYAFCTESGLMESILSLTSGNSIYAIDTSRNGDAIIAGTKTGLLYWLCDQSSENTDYNIDKVIHGSAILSVCLLDNFRWAVSDISGRCLIWQSDSRTFENLPTEDNIICSLFKPVQDRLAGVSKEGKLFIWDINSMEIIDLLQVPKPPSLAALVKPVWWPQAKHWAWSGSDGLIVLFDPARNKIDTITAHTSDAYGICLYQKNLLSAGRRDRALKVWQAGQKQPVRIFDIPSGVISAVSWPDETYWNILISKETGESEIYTYDGKQLEFSRTIAARNCRSIAGPDIEAIKAGRRQKTMKKAESICLEIRQNISAQQYDRLFDLYTQLENLGFTNASLLLKARESLAKEDLISELQAHIRLDELLSCHKKVLPTALERYAQLLKKTWSIEQALSAYKRLKDICRDNQIYENEIRRLTSYVEIINKGQYIIEPDIRPVDLLKAALLFGNHIGERLVIKTINSARLSSKISFCDFIDCYRELGIRNPSLPTPEIIEQHHWLTENESISSEIAFFKDTTAANFENMELCVRFAGSDFDTSVKTAVVFNTKKLSGELQTAQGRQNIIEELQSLENMANITGPFRSIQENVNFILRQLITKNAAQKRTIMRSY